jgi:transcriptional regulator with XRE-family HTH domain
MADLIHIFAANLRMYRLRAGLSQEDLADRAGLHRTYIGSIERGERNVSLRNVEKIAAALNIKPIALLEDSNTADE